MFKRHPIAAPVLILSFALLLVFVRMRELVPVAACTLAACPPGVECNSCAFRGWGYETTFGHVEATGKLEDCEVNGFAQCPFQLYALGIEVLPLGRFHSIARFRIDPDEFSADANPLFCTSDQQCNLASSCLGCNRCYRVDPAARAGLDCEAICRPRTDLGCACIAGRCETREILQ